MKPAIFAVTLLTLCMPVTLLAHGFGQRIDLPVPLSLYLLGAGAVVSLSFILLGLFSGKLSKGFTTYPTINLTRFTDNGLTTVAVEFIKFLLVLTLIISVISGFMGNPSPAFNILPTVVWIVFAIGVTFFSAFIGDIWKVINPFRTLFGYLEELLSLFGIASTPWRWRVIWGVWPALVLFFCFRWIENVSPFSSEPRALAFLVFLYGGITFVGMTLFGKESWLQKGDPFSVFFTILSQFSITETRVVGGKTELHLRPPVVGLLKQTPTISEVAFILLMLSSVAADGVLSTPIFQGLFIKLLDFNIPWGIVGTVGLLGLYVIFVATYTLFCLLMKVVSSDSGKLMEFTKSFVYSLLPIAIVYEFAHFVSILVIEGQRVVYLISDPLGVGWNIFGTAGYELNYTLLNLKVLWHVQVALIVIGHVIAVFVAHTVAERYFKNSKKVLLSQYPMLILMIFYSILSLWIMAQPIVAIE